MVEVVGVALLEVLVMMVAVILAALGSSIEVVPLVAVVLVVVLSSSLPVWFGMLCWWVC